MLEILGNIHTIILAKPMIKISDGVTICLR